MGITPGSPDAERAAVQRQLEACAVHEIGDADLLGALVGGVDPRRRQRIGRCDGVVGDRWRAGVVAHARPGADLLAQPIVRRDVDALVRRGTLDLADLDRVRRDPHVAARDQVVHAGARAALVDRRRVDLRPRRSIGKVLAVIADGHCWRPAAGHAVGFLARPDDIAGHERRRQRQEGALRLWESARNAGQHDGAVTLDI